MPSPNLFFRQGKASRTRTRLPRKLREPVEVPLLGDDGNGDGNAFEEDCALGSGDWDWEWDEDAGKGLGLAGTSGESGIGFAAGIVGSGLIGNGIGIVGEKIGEKIPGYRVSAGKLLLLFQGAYIVSRAEISHFTTNAPLMLIRPFSHVQHFSPPSAKTSPSQPPSFPPTPPPRPPQPCPPLPPSTPPPLSPPLNNQHSHRAPPPPRSPPPPQTAKQTQTPSPNSATPSPQPPTRNTRR